MDYKSYHIISLFGLAILNLFINCKSVSQMHDKYKLNDTVTISGQISSSTYLSRSDDSDKEYFNDAYNLTLEKNIEIIDNKDSTKKYKDINHIEIEDDYQYEIYRFVGKKATIKGILSTFTELYGYHRQYSTPIQIKIIEIEIEGNDCKGGKKDALKEIGEKKISLVIFGPKRYDGQFAEFFAEYLIKKHNIKLNIYGCELDEYIQCYEKEMSKELVKLYGENYLERLENEAKQEYNKK
jgi:hypothetical protein